MDGEYIYLYRRIYFRMCYPLQFCNLAVAVDIDFFDGPSSAFHTTYFHLV